MTNTEVHMLEYMATTLYVLAGRCIFTLSLVTFLHPLDTGEGNLHFFALSVRISVSNLDWKLARGSATKICWSFDDAP